MTMKWKVSTLALCTAISFATFNAAAAESVNMSVIGTITPGSCTPTLSAASVDYGTINAASLTAVAPALNQLGSKEVTLSIACTGATLVGIAATDARAATTIALSEDTYIANTSKSRSDYNVTNSGQAYGLGVAGTESTNIGAYSIAMNLGDITATDGADANLNVEMMSVRQTSTDWTKSVTGMINPLSGALANITTFASAGTITPVAIKNATIPLTITAAVQPMSQFSLAGESITLNGNATIGLVYL